ncbi:SLBB domain-containing protein [Actinocrinis puniceicyclus]|uniref:SLBB domain-containing protein n=1 Tax=Actinocrinis puniceicyclus TaxID=977794 RepID=A0A8J7WSZ5_9ACTN|nr:NADH-ubiquinone oxidoreductase-F iron-sulfur binding region domain-containing protein [Actinocrinis puniceicyclus]MBS2966215.1 SLBB domain-containing protein [Actinocrinis puniceicyclus]
MSQPSDPTAQLPTAQFPTAQFPTAVPPPGLLDGSAHLPTHVATFGALPALAAEQVLAAAGRAGLTGRGGAGFPVERKMRAVAASAAKSRRGARSEPVVIANGCEGEPASGKDGALLRRSPHLVLDGIALAARAVGARTAYLCVHEDDSAVRQTVQDAIAQREAVRSDEVDVVVVGVPARYSASEETALVSAVEGGPALPRFTPPRPFERGVGGRPTLINNVETLAHLALICRRGPDWFRAAGTPDAPGTTLVTVSGAVAAPSVHEIPLGIPVSELIALAGGATEPLQALLVGGYFGTWLPAADAPHTPVTPRGLAAAGTSLGAGVFVAFPQAACGLAETARVARYLARHSAGQCGPCVNGLPALASALEALAFKGDQRAPAYLNRMTGFVTGRGACRLPDGATRLITSALTVFAQDVRAHARSGPCPAARRAPLLPTPAEPGAGLGAASALSGASARGVVAR